MQSCARAVVPVTVHPEGRAVTFVRYPDSHCSCIRAPLLPLTPDVQRREPHDVSQARHGFSVTFITRCPRHFQIHDRRQQLMVVLQEKFVPREGVAEALFIPLRSLPTQQWMQHFARGAFVHPGPVSR